MSVKGPLSLANRQGPWVELQLEHEDRASINCISPSDLGSWFEQRIAEHDYRLRALKFAHNAAASSINRKRPREVLVEIFALLPLKGSGYYEYRHTSYLLVCRAWYSLLLQTPRFWAALLNKPHLLTNGYWGTVRGNALYDRYLERSGAVALGLPIHLTSDHILRSLSPHCHRITRLYVRITPERELEGPVLHSLLSAGMPSLVDLDVTHTHVYNPPRTGGPLILNARHLPGLHSLAHPWTSTVIGDAVARLRYLRLEGCNWCETPR